MQTPRPGLAPALDRNLILGRGIDANLVLGGCERCSLFGELLAASPGACRPRSLLPWHDWSMPCRPGHALRWQGPVCLFAPQCACTKEGGLGKGWVALGKEAGAGTHLLRGSYLASVLPLCRGWGWAWGSQSLLLPMQSPPSSPQAPGGSLSCEARRGAWSTWGQADLAPATRQPLSRGRGPAPPPRAEVQRAEGTLLGAVHRAGAGGCFPLSATLPSRLGPSHFPGTDVLAAPGHAGGSSSSLL